MYGWLCCSSPLISVISTYSAESLDWRLAFREAGVMEGVWVREEEEEEEVGASVEVAMRWVVVVWKDEVMRV